MSPSRHPYKSLLLLALLLLTITLTQPAFSQHDHAKMLAEESAAAAQSPAAPANAGLFETYTPRRLCMNNEPDVIWLSLISDALIAASYYSIPIALVYFARRRKDLSFNKMFFAFAIFILACGTTHVFGIIAIWNPLYRLDGIIKAFTAAVSVATAIALWPLVPKALRIPSPATLALANRQLETEIQHRNKIESDLRTLTGDLERRVSERTAELEAANAHLRNEVEARRAAERQREDLLASERVARAEAEKASRMKDDFVATLSHELRTPISAILGWTQVLQSPHAKPDDLAEGLEIIERNTRVQTQLIEDLLDMSRIMSGKLRLDVQPVNLAQVISAAIETVRPAAAAKEISLHPVLDPHAGPIMGDPNRLQQIVWNLLNNAVKFTPRGGKVQIQLSRINSHIDLSVSDNGAGISTEFLPHLFERFRQANSSTTRRHGGLGLGLAIVRQLTELHGGTVRAASPGENKGASFTVEFPVASVQSAAPEPRQHPATATGKSNLTAPSLGGIRVLVVDDEPDSRALVKRVLEDGGALVDLAGSAREAYQLIRQNRPAVILSDIGMPDEDGYSLIQTVRSWPDSEGGATPAVALTAFARAEDRRRALLVGFQMHMAKPVEHTELLAVIASISGRTARANG